MADPASKLALAIKYLHPTKVAGVDYILRDDGNGPFIAQWNITGGQPTQGQINSAYGQFVAAQAQEKAARKGRKIAALAKMGITSAAEKKGYFESIEDRHAD